MNIIDQFFELKIDLSSIGLLRAQDREGYFCTPVEALILAWSGVDGIHYCIIPKDEESIELSPVYVIDPSDSSSFVRIVARNFRDFLSIVITTKDASVLCCSYQSEEDLNNHIGTINNDIANDNTYKHEVEETISYLKKTFNITEIQDIYNYMEETLSNPKFHAKYTFSEEYYTIMG
jgi:hypothetical protein